MIKRSIRTVLSAGGHNVTWWPLVAKHVGERRLRAQLRSFGYPVGDLLRFGTKAYALRKWWQHRYEQWRDIREPVVILGPDACSTLTTTNYFVQAIDSGRYFFTNDVITPDFAATEEAVLGPAAGDPAAHAVAAAPRPILPDDAIYLPERDEISHPAGLALQPARRLRSKTSPAMLHRLSGAPIEGEKKDSPEMGVDVFAALENLRRVNTPPGDRETDEESWTLETRSSPTPSQRSSDGSGGGEVEEAPNSRAGGSHPTASFEDQRCFLRPTSDATQLASTGDGRDEPDRRHC